MSLLKPILNILERWSTNSKIATRLLFGAALLSIILTNYLLPNLPQWLNASSSHLHYFHLPSSLLLFVNDGLMTLFFLVVGVEIKREFTIGELKDTRQALLPIFSAIGGMLVPAIIFLIFTSNDASFKKGWAIPTATDIAFSLGVLSIVSKRIPNSLKVFLMALAIIDDLGAIIIMALFYGGSFNVWWIIVAAILCIVIYVVNVKTKQFGWWYIPLFMLLWYALHSSGIHATLAGVVFALLVENEHLEMIEHKLIKLTNLLILPLFAFCNLAIPIIIPNAGANIPWQIVLGIFLGLCLGKPVGILFGALLNKFLGGQLKPIGATILQFIGVAILAGIGFTMSIFIANLSFTESKLNNVAKTTILVASIISSIVGLFCLSVYKKRG
jgi:Na+:H+ antiporter, NhaA family